MISEFCTDRITYLFTRYTSTEAMEEILIRLQLLYHGLLTSCRNVYILCSQCRVNRKKLGVCIDNVHQNVLKK